MVAPDHRLLPAQTGPPPQREPAWARIPFYPVLLGFALVAVAYIQTDVSVLAVLRTLGVVLVGSLALYLIVWGAPNTQQIMRACEPVLGRIASGPFSALVWRPSLGCAFAFGCAGALALASLGGTSEFLYYRF